VTQETETIFNQLIDICENCREGDSYYINLKFIEFIKSNFEIIRQNMMAIVHDDGYINYEDCDVFYMRHYDKEGYLNYNISYNILSYETQAGTEEFVVPLGLFVLMRQYAALQLITSIVNYRPEIKDYIYYAIENDI